MTKASINAIAQQHNLLVPGVKYSKKVRVILIAQAFIFVILLLMLIPQPVSAYLDPGFGSMVWQLVVTVLFGVVFTLKMYWQKIREFFNRRKHNNNPEMKEP